MSPTLELSQSRGASAALTGMIDCIAAELSLVERRFNEELRSDVKCVNALVRHVARFRGKMLRPILVLLSGKAACRVGAVSDAHVTIATVVEMVHMATLVHDDVLDEAELRRKGATLNHLRGNEAAVLLGDYLISHSYHLCSSLSSPRVSRVIAHTTNQVCEGELLQIHNRNNLDLEEGEYYAIVARKTGVLCAVCCMLGAQFSSASEAVVKGMENYGLSLGIAFQIQDDILDLLGDREVVGKTLGSDIRKGKLTLPLIHFLRHAPREHRLLLRSLLESPDGDKVERIRNLVLPSESIPYARAAAAARIAEAKESLALLPDSPPKRVLLAMADFVISRPM